MLKRCNNKTFTKTKETYEYCNLGTSGMKIDFCYKCKKRNTKHQGKPMICWSKK